MYQAGRNGRGEFVSWVYNSCAPPGEVLDRRSAWQPFS